MTVENGQLGTFRDLGLNPKILAVLDRMKFSVPTPIQHQSIPAGLAGKDIIGIAQTGTGKTLAFGLPTIQRLMEGPGRALALLPTRELALQVEETFMNVGKGLGVTTAVLIGGASMHRQVMNLKRRPRVIIATPGRLIDHLEHKTVQLDDINVLILDEADRMLDMGFAPQINEILKRVPKERQTMLYSATMPSGIVSIAARHMALPVRVEVAPPGTSAENVEQEVIILFKEDKQSQLETILTEEKGTVLVFSRTKFGARKMCRSLIQKGFNAAEIHADRTLAQRREALDGFKSGKYRILVATDIAARGIDVTNIGLVLNFDLPDNSEDYVHRIGRTGRAGREGKAISFATPDQRRDIKEIERLIRKSLKVMSTVPLPEEPKRGHLPGSASSRRPGETRGGGRRFGGRGRRR